MTNTDTLNKEQESWCIEHSIETSAAPAAIWALFSDVSSWKQWNAGVEAIHLEGPFAEGTWFTMVQPGGEALRSRLVDVRPSECFVDETRVGDLMVTVAHRLTPVGTSGTRITYAVEATGPDAGAIGPMVAADFPAVLAALASRAVGGPA